MAFLLDANLLIALMWPAHMDHDRAQEWFAENAHRGWATCPFTQAAFVRIVANPAFSSDAVSPLEAAQILAHNIQHAKHQFWADDMPVTQAIAPFSKRLTGHRQVTDAYLLALVTQRKGKLATLDRRLAHLLPGGDKASDILQFVG